MKFRRTKSVILLCLIISSLILSINVWFSEELWPSGYNFFIMLKNTPLARELFRPEEPYSMPKENLSKPQKIIVTNNDGRSIYYNTNDSFGSLHDIVKGFLSYALKNEDSITNRAEASEEEWRAVLKNDENLGIRSIYVDYSLAYTPGLYAHMIGIQNTWIEKEMSSLKEFIIAPIAPGGGGVLFYVRDFGDGKIRKYLSSYDKKDDVYKAASEYTKTDSSSYSFSFELNLHNASGIGVGAGLVQKVFVDPMVLVSPGASDTPVIESANPLSGGDLPSEGLLSVFGFPPSLHYTDPAGVLYYVDNYSLLKIYPDGLIEYTADNESMGIELSDTDIGLYESLNKTIEFSENVWKSVEPEEPFNVLVTSNLLENTDDEEAYSFTLDYYCYGNPVTIEVASPAYGRLNHAVEIDVKNGKIIRYRHFLRKYQNTGRMTANLPMIDALDSIYKSLSDEAGEILIEDIYLSYIENGDGFAKAPVWCARIAGSESIVHK